jgi:hypothetical protein
LRDYVDIQIDASRSHQGMTPMDVLAFGEGSNTDPEWEWSEAEDAELNYAGWGDAKGKGKKGKRTGRKGDPKGKGEEDPKGGGKAKWPEEVCAVGPRGATTLSVGSRTRP